MNGKRITATNIGSSGEIKHRHSGTGSNNDEVCNDDAHGDVGGWVAQRGCKGR